MTKERDNGYRSLTEEDIFCTPDNFALTDFGSKLYGLVLAHDSLNDPEMTDERREQVYQDIGKRCEENRLLRSEMQNLGDQLHSIVRYRVDRLSTISGRDSVHKKAGVVIQ